MNRVNQLAIESAEAMAVELAERGEKWPAQTIAGLLILIENISSELHALRRDQSKDLYRRISQASPIE